MRRCKIGRKATVKSKTDYTADRSSDKHCENDAKDVGRTADMKEDTGKTSPRQKEMSQVVSTDCHASTQNETIAAEKNKGTDNLFEHCKVSDAEEDAGAKDSTGEMQDDGSDPQRR